MLRQVDETTSDQGLFTTINTSLEKSCKQGTHKYQKRFK